MNKKVVIVEDDRLLTIVLRKMATSMGYDVLATCPGGRHAIEIVMSHKPDLVIMDIMLADDVSGIEAMKSIRDYSDVPVVYITAQNDSRIRQEASSIENSAYLLKPIKVSHLQEAIQTVQFAA